jgi:phosphatidylserine/phosphatidylglycerophosphate/cardiolipin synthase-like enzyme
MKATQTQDGLTLRATAGTHNVLLGMDLQDGLQTGCLGFTIERTHLGSPGAPLPAGKQAHRFLPNMLRFPKDQQAQNITTDRAPIQKFRWGDYTTTPGHTYRYRVTAQYGKWDQLEPRRSVEVTVTTEDPANPDTAVFFNRGAAASEAYTARFHNGDPATTPGALTWLSRGLEEALLAFLARAKDGHFALHAAIYEFQKPELLQGLHDALTRGATVEVVYHDRLKRKKDGTPDPKDHTGQRNEAAALAKGLDAVSVRRKADPQGAISHDKFVVLLEDGTPKAVWTGSTNWTEGAIYGQLNVGHAIYDPAVAQTYDAYFQLLRADPDADSLKQALSTLTTVPNTVPTAPGIYPIFSPQRNKKMLDLYAAICQQARCLLVCAPFELAVPIRDALKQPSAGALRFLLTDTKRSLGDAQEVSALEGDTGNEVSAAITLKSPLHDFQNKLLAGEESFHHAGIHIHAKIIAADPFGDDPIIVMGSANFSTNSTVSNDSNSLLIRGQTKIADIYATEFMRMFEHYYFRGKVAQAPANQPLGLKEDDRWTARYYVPDSSGARGRKLFAGT